MRKSPMIRMQIMSADKVIFPGVGEAATTMDYLKERGLDKADCRTDPACSRNLPGSAAHVQLVGRRGYRLHRDL